MEGWMEGLLGSGRFWVFSSHVGCGGPGMIGLGESLWLAACSCRMAILTILRGGLP